MFEKSRIRTLLLRATATVLLVTTGIFSVNFYVSYVSSCALPAIWVSEEERSETEKEVEKKETETELEDVFHESRQFHLIAAIDLRYLSLQKTSIYCSFVSKVTTPPPRPLAA